MVNTAHIVGERGPEEIPGDLPDTIVQTLTLRPGDRLVFVWPADITPAAFDEAVKATEGKLGDVEVLHVSGVEQLVVLRNAAVEQ